MPTSTKQSKWLTVSKSLNTNNTNATKRTAHSIDISSILSNYNKNSFTYNAIGPGLESVTAGVPSKINLDQIFPPLEPSQKIHAILQHSNPTHPQVPATVLQHNHSSLTISFTLTKSGPYTLSLSLLSPSSDVSLPAPSLKVSCVPFLPCPLHTLCNGPGLTFAAPEESASFVVTSFDPFGNRCRNGGAALTVTIEGNAVLDGETVDEGDGTYTVSYTPTRGIQKLANVTLGTKRHHEGLISVATTDRGEWNDRWFVLVDSELMCYRSERWEEEGEKAMITLDLTECAVSEHVEFEEEAPRSKGHHFQVVAPHITLQMSAVEVRWGWDGRE